jgi:hypothetical protein
MAGVVIYICNERSRNSNTEIIILIKISENLSAEKP